MRQQIGEVSPNKGYNLMDNLSWVVFLLAVTRTQGGHSLAQLESFNSAMGVTIEQLRLPLKGRTKTPEHRARARHGRGHACSGARTQWPAPAGSGGSRSVNARHRYLLA